MPSSRSLNLPHCHIFITKFFIVIQLVLAALGLSYVHWPCDVHQCQTWGSEDSGVLWCDAVSLGEWLPAFRWFIMPSSTGVKQSPWTEGLSPMEDQTWPNGSRIHFYQFVFVWNKVVHMRVVHKDVLHRRVRPCDDSRAERKTCQSILHLSLQSSILRACKCSHIIDRRGVNK